MFTFEQNIENYLNLNFNTNIKNATVAQLHSAVAIATVKEIKESNKANKKQACYFSAEFLIGRLVHSNLLNLGLLDTLERILQKNGRESIVFEKIDDAALGNGGLGRLAACFLDSAASIGVPLDGYGIKYKYGLFKQRFENGFQIESPDDWQEDNDVLFERKEDEKVLVKFGDDVVFAVPYDTKVIGFGGETVNRLRLWQAEPVEKFNLTLFNEQKYNLANKKRDTAEAISAVLYPNDDTNAGKILRLKQQYFFSSASLRSIISDYIKKNGINFSKFADSYAIQLNDTHPVISIPELIRILCEEYNLPFNAAFEIAKNTFAYTNHTLLAEALEKWDIKIFKKVLPEVFSYVMKIEEKLESELPNDKLYKIISERKVHMARLAIYGTHSTNGVAKIHTELIKTVALKEWYAVFPERFSNKTNGVTPRRWLALCNKELTMLIKSKIGSGFISDLDLLAKLNEFCDDNGFLEELNKVKLQKKKQLCEYIFEKEGINLTSDYIFDIQVKRMHEYKRQLLNAFSILDIYFGIKEGRIKNYNKTVFIFGGKAAPGYKLAKGIIKFINEIGKLIANDCEVCDVLKLIFVADYNVSYAEKLIPAADVSEQISTAGLEASGTGNMKFMMNGAVTLGTLDGANVEIVNYAGIDNNYIFGATVDELKELTGSYIPKDVYENNSRLKKVVDTLIDGTLDDNETGVFKDIYDSLINEDRFFVLHDFDDYCTTKLRLNTEYSDKTVFAKKCLKNIANSGFFSSDRTIAEYAKEIWGM